MSPDAAAAGRPIEILLVEDSPGDARLTQEAFREAMVLNELHIVPDGVEAMRYLRREGEYAERPSPDLILLDLNMPRMDGRQVLRAIKGDERLRRIPVVVLTVSRDERDVLQAYNLHANAYVEKPVDFAKFLEAVHSIGGFWLRVVRLPPA
jgi:two-component system, chemotaxis family, response regulator Rcp1